MTEKRTSHYLLATIKVAFTASLPEPHPVCRRRGRALAMDESDVVAVVHGLSGIDFDKSMTSYADATVWQDVYKPTKDGRRLYVKFTLNSQKELFLISFKKA